MLSKQTASFFCLILMLPFSLIAQKDSVSSMTNLLGLSMEELMNVKVVTASGYLQPLSEAPSTITVITDREIAERGYEQLEDALRNIPGIDMIHINGYAPTLIYFRGMYGAENLRALLMIDGIVENNILGTNDMAGPAYSLHNVQRIEIIWGPVSALYGANAFGGIINIISKKGEVVNGLHAEQGAGSFSTSFEKLSLGSRQGKYEYAFAGSIFSSAGPKFSNRDPQYDASYVDKAYSLNAAASYYANDQSKTTLGFRTYRTPIGWGTYANSPTVYLGLPAQGNDNQGTIGVLQRSFRGEKSGLDDSFLRTLFLQEYYKASEKLNITARAIYRETGTADDSYIYVTVDGKRLIRSGVTTYSNRVSGEVSANYSPGSNHHFSGGVAFTRDNVERGSRGVTYDPNTVYLVDGRDTVVNINSTFLTRVFDIRNNFGSYLQYVLNTKLLGSTNFTLGGRFDHNSYFGNALSPRIAVVNQLNEKLTLKLQGGTAFRAPTNLEIYQTPGGNFKLKQEKLRTLEINGIYAFSKDFRLQLNGFHNKLTDVIVLGNLSGLNPNKNPGELTINGIEAALDMKFTKNVNGFVNFTYQDATGKNLVTQYTGPVPGVAKVKGNAGLTVHTGNIFIITVTGNWVGTRQSPRTDPYGPVKGYLLVNWVLSTEKLFKSGVTASLNIHNLFNTKWLDPGFRTADGMLYSTVLEQPGINGIFKIGITL